MFFRFQNTFWLLSFISPRGGGFQCSLFLLLRQENCFGFSTHLGKLAAVAFHTTTLSFPLHMFCEPLFFESCLLKKFAFLKLFLFPIGLFHLFLFRHFKWIRFLLEDCGRNPSTNGMSNNFRLTSPKLGFRPTN